MSNVISINSGKSKNNEDENNEATADDFPYHYLVHYFLENGCLGRTFVSSSSIHPTRETIEDWEEIIKENNNGTRVGITSFVPLAS